MFSVLVDLVEWCKKPLTRKRPRDRFLGSTKSRIHGRQRSCSCIQIPDCQSFLWSIIRVGPLGLPSAQRLRFSCKVDLWSDVSHTMVCAIVIDLACVTHIDPVDAYDAFPIFCDYCKLCILTHGSCVRLCYREAASSSLTFSVLRLSLVTVSFNSGVMNTIYFNIKNLLVQKIYI